MSRKPFLVAVVALVLLPGLVLAAGRPSPDQILHNPRLLARYLQLTPDQVTRAQGLFQQLQTAVRPLHEQEAALADQLKTLLDAPSPNACEVGNVVVQLDGLRDQAHAALQKFDHDFSAILTPAQLAKYEALKEAAHIGDDDTQP
jgi:Spy/CpxP family protein refolding chaperone